MKSYFSTVRKLINIGGYGIREAWASVPTFPRSGWINFEKSLNSSEKLRITTVAIKCSDQG